jgi:predicted ATP-binding protein involved in virulence
MESEYRGLEVLDYIKKKSLLAPVIIITAHGTDEIATDSIKKGVLHFMEKGEKGEKGASNRKIRQNVKHALQVYTNNMHTIKKNVCYFLNMKLENVACFGLPQILDLSNKKGEPARWTVIIGDNAIGKTTLLRCLAGISPYSGKDPGGMTFTVNALNWDFERSQKEAVVEAQFAADCKFTDNEKKYRIFERKFKGNSLKNSIDSDPIFSHLDFICYGYGAARRMSPSKIQTEIRDFKSLNLFDDDTALMNVEQWLIQLDYISVKEEKYSGYKKQVEDIIRNLLPDVTGIEYRIDKQVSNVIFKTPTGWVGIHQLGLGYRTMLSWMIDFAASLFERYPESKNPLEEPAVLLLDEIDLHLHPKWQRTIIDYLTQRFPNTQFIATAHSPLLVQAAAGANIVLLKRKGDKIIIENDPTSVKNWRVDQILTSDLFGVESAHSKEVHNCLKERYRLLSKKKLSPKDNERLRELDVVLSSIPYGDTKEEIEVNFLIKEIAEKIRVRNKTEKTGND